MSIFSKRNVITQYIEINMYNIHAHIEREREKKEENIEKYSNGKEKQVTYT